MSDDYVAEACFYLSETDHPKKEIAEAFNLSVSQVNRAISSYRKKISRGEAKYEEDAKQFWARNYKESSGDEKITLVDERGSYYHGWKSELEQLPSEKIVELLVVNKNYSDKHPLSEFSKGSAVIGYDPLIPLRNIRKTVALLEEMLSTKEREAGSDHKS